MVNLPIALKAHPKKILIENQIEIRTLEAGDRKDVTIRGKLVTPLLGGGKPCNSIEMTGV